MLNLGKEIVMSYWKDDNGCSKNPHSINKSKSESTKIIHIVVVGHKECGKTQLLNRMINDKFDRRYLVTIGIDFFQ